jgi:hypothetical protein
MAADDLVIYNGIQMRRDYAESLEQAQRTIYYRAEDSLVPRIRFGNETYPMVTQGEGLCPCCSAAHGQCHEPLCEREQCPVCKRQVMSCDCDISTDDAVEA